VGFLNALYIIPILAVLIFLHELGHFVMARRAGVRVEEFGFGLPPRIWGVQRGDTLYSINALPIGGFVRVLGEDGKSREPDSMQAKSAGQRASFLAAGSIMNFLTALLLIFVIIAFQGQTTERAYITDVVAGSPAAAAGMQVGDRIVSAGGEEIEEIDDLQPVTERYIGESMPVVLDRFGEIIHTSVVPREDPPAGEGRTGVRVQQSRLADIRVEDVPAGTTAESVGLLAGDELVAVDGHPITDYLAYASYLLVNQGETVQLEVERQGQLLTIPVEVPITFPEGTEPLGADLVQDLEFTRVPIAQIPVESVRVFFDSIRQMGQGLLSLIRGETPLDDLAGPIGMGQLTSEVISESSLPLWVTLANLTFILSLNLGLLNLLPLPALDGGRLMFVLLEVLRGGKRIAPEKEGLVHFVGMVVLLTAMFVIAFVDIDRLISGNSFLE
jgi:regulator of sigma E protease